LVQWVVEEVETYANDWMIMHHGKERYFEKYNMWLMENSNSTLTHMLLWVHLMHKNPQPIIRQLQEGEL
jgi:hypothetical protein